MIKCQKLFMIKLFLHNFSYFLKITYSFLIFVSSVFFYFFFYSIVIAYVVFADFEFKYIEK